MPPKQQSEADSRERSNALEPAPGKFFDIAYLMPRQLAQAVRRGFLKSKRVLDASLAAWFGFPRSPPAPTLIDLLSKTDSLIISEVQNGCFGDVEMMLGEFRKIILEKRVVYTGTDAENVALDQLWVNLLRLGLFDELLILIRGHNLPLRPEVRRFIDYCEYQYGVSGRQGEAYRARYPGLDIFTMGCIVWGDEYVDNFLRYNLRSMLSEGNLPSLRLQGQVVFSIVTDAASERRMRRDPLFAKLSDVADVSFIIVPDEMISTLITGHLVQNFYILYGMLDHCSIYFAEGAVSHLFMIPVDSIVADGSLQNMANYRHEGYECCGGGNIVAETETFLPALDVRFGGDGPIRISTEELATLAAEHAHHYFRSQIVAVENEDFGKHPREIFWPVDGGIEIHSVFIHPLFTSTSGLAKYSRKHFANVDYGMIPRMFAGREPIKVLEPRKAYVNNFTASSRLYETTGRPFAIEDFLRSHNFSYPVQKSLFGQPQALPCRLGGWTAYGNVAQDVCTVNACFGIVEDEEVKRQPSQSGESNRIEVQSRDHPGD